MAKDKFKTSVGWDVFQSMGNPENPDIPTEDEGQTEKPKALDDVLRVYLERKGRGGKVVSVIKGLTLSEGAMSDMCKLLKSKCGVGGYIKNEEIIIQGDQRIRLIKELGSLGYHNIKNAGS
jgi:translation initiation factor 1